MAARGETSALCVSKSKGVAALQSLVGPADPKEVRVTSPECCARTNLFMKFRWFVVCFVFPLVNVHTSAGVAPNV